MDPALSLFILKSFLFFNLCLAFNLGALGSCLSSEAGPWSAACCCEAMGGFPPPVPALVLERSSWVLGRPHWQCS